MQTYVWFSTHVCIADRSKQERKSAVAPQPEGPYNTHASHAKCLASAGSYGHRRWPQLTLQKQMHEVQESSTWRGGLSYWPTKGPRAPGIVESADFPSASSALPKSANERFEHFTVAHVGKHATAVYQARLHASMVCWQMLVATVAQGRNQRGRCRTVYSADVATSIKPRQLHVGTYHHMQIDSNMAQGAQAHWRHVKAKRRTATTRAQRTINAHVS